MQKNKKLSNPFVRKNDSVSRVMGDVCIALLPCMAISTLAYGYYPLLVITTCVVSAVLTEYLFSRITGRHRHSVRDGSAVVTGLLLAFTIGSFTPLPIVALGGCTAVLFGKLLWGGLGRNRFNPALIGREFMVVLFPAIMNSTDIWGDRAHFQVRHLDVFPGQLPDRLFYHPIGALGEYSPLLLLAGGVYLLWRRRISWHIPTALLVTFGILVLLTFRQGYIFTMGGVMLGALYMATDMPTSSSCKAGKLYFGAMTGVLAMICLLSDVEKGYLSYSLLIMNAYVQPMNRIFRPRVWGKTLPWTKRLLEAVGLTALLLLTVMVVIGLHRLDAVLWVMLAYAVYTVFRYTWVVRKEPPEFPW